MRSGARWTAVAVVAFLSTGGVLALGQSAGDAGGTVRDTAGNVMPGVTVTAEGPGVGGKPRSTTTTAKGTYEFSTLPAGSYDITFELVGFTSVKIEKVTIQAGSNDPLDARMRVADAETRPCSGPACGYGVILISRGPRHSNSAPDPDEVGR